MKLLHIYESRCAGRDTKPNPTICSERQSCLRHTQMTKDREMGLESLKIIKVMTLPRVGTHACNYHLRQTP